MRRARSGWLGAGLLASAVLALGACGSKGRSTSEGTGGATTTGATTSSTGTTSTSTTATTSTTTMGAGGTGGAAPAIGDSVLMHHRSPSHDGVYVQPKLTKGVVPWMTLDPSFDGAVQGAIFAQPLFVDGLGGKDLVVVATNLNNVVALDAATGLPVWTQNLGAPVPLAALACGNIDPYGVTGTPVIDFASRTVFVDAMTSPDGGTTKRHLIFGLSLDTGAIRPGWPVDTTTQAKSGALAFDPQYQGQRGALAVANGTVYVPYGGLAGDCGVYHGWVVGISIADPTNVQAWATPADSGGSWQPGGIASDGTSIFISTGNTSNTSVWGGGDALIRFGTGAAFGMATGFFAPTNWLYLDDHDLDLGTGPVLFDLPGSTPSELALVFGKDGNAYLLDRNNLGGVSNALATLQVAASQIISAPAVYTTPTATYAVTWAPNPRCPGGGDAGANDTAAIRIVPGAPPTLALAWCALAGNGSPMVTTSDGHSDAVVWSLGASYDLRLHGFDGDTGAPLFTSATTVGSPRRFNVGIAAKGRMFWATDGVVRAFKP
jgi:hypothetical protein